MSHVRPRPEGHGLQQGLRAETTRPCFMPRLQMDWEGLGSGAMISPGKAATRDSSTAFSRATLDVAFSFQEGILSGGSRES